MKEEENLYSSSEQELTKYEKDMLLSFQEAQEIFKEIGLTPRQLADRVKELEQQNEELKHLGLKATELIGHLKDQHGFNDVEDYTFNKFRKIFGYKGDW